MLILPTNKLSKHKIDSALTLEPLDTHAKCLPHVHFLSKYHTCYSSHHKCQTNTTYLSWNLGFLWKLLKYLEPMVLWIWFFSNTQEWRVLQNADTHPRLKWMWLENWLIPGQGWLMFFTTKERFVCCWCAWHGHKATQQRTKDVIVVYANFTASKCIFICQMLSLDFEWIHWSHWRGCSCDLVNSLVPLNRD
jgi:hypothetical protein